VTGLRELEDWPRLDFGAVQVWRVDAAAAAHNGLLWLLPDEVARARQMRPGLARDEFVAGRAVLRRLLARELGCQPKELRLRTGAAGKLAADGIDFNVAHSRGVVLIALSRAGAVGIDLEHEDRTVEALDIARVSFHEEEIRWIEGVPEEQRAAVFFRCWTRKEAVVKADGRGLSLPLNSFSVCCEGDGEELVRLDGYSCPYYVRGLPARSGEIAALVLARAGAPVTMHEWAGRGEEADVSAMETPVPAPDVQPVIT